MGPITIMLYRSTSPDDPVDYVAALGSGGTTLSLEQTGEQDKGKPVWWLTLDQFKERVVLQQWRGPVDDADFIRSFAELPAIMRAPPVTVVARN